MAPALSLQPRDLLVLQGLLECRVMTLAHLADVYFEGKNEAAKKRLQKLKAAGYVAERPRRAYDPSILFLSRKAFELLRDEGFVDKYPRLSITAFEKRSHVSELTIRHELGVLSVKAALHAAVRKTEHLSIAEFGTWPKLYEFEAEHSTKQQNIVVRPDGFIRIHEKEPDGGVSEHCFFLEVDRSTETLDTLAAKASNYVEFFRSGGFAVRCGGLREQFRKFPFRVLVVCKSDARRQNLLQRLAQRDHPIFTQVCVTTSALAEAPLSEVWITPCNWLVMKQETIIS